MAPVIRSAPMAETVRVLRARSSPAADAAATAETVVAPTAASHERALMEEIALLRSDAARISAAHVAALAAQKQEFEDSMAARSVVAEHRGYEAGLLSGEQAGRAQAAEEVARLHSRLAELAESLAGAREASLLQAEDTLLEITVAAVCKIIGRAAIDGSALRSMASECLQAARGQEPLRLHVHPADQLLLQDVRLPEGVTVVADAAVGAGGCLVRSNAGELDARLDKQLAILRDTLLAARARRGDV